MPENLQSGRYRVRVTTSGAPQNFSFVRLIKDALELEVHSNVGVRGHSTVDEGRYVVDVGVLKPEAVPRKVSRGELATAANEALITFVEAKHIVIYPMLLAQFVGTVHELKPAHIKRERPEGYNLDPAFLPGTGRNSIPQRECSPDC